MVRRAWATPDWFTKCMNRSAVRSLTLHGSMRRIGCDLSRLPSSWKPRSRSSDKATAVPHGRMRPLALRQPAHMPKAPLQYIENHDHSRFLCEFDLVHRDRNPLFAEGNREHWYRVQPYLTALLAAKGIPMLWQGQEFGENYFLPREGLGRVLLLRPLRWDYFYDTAGKNLVKLTRSLVNLRKNCIELRRGSHYFHNNYEHYLSRGILLFQRENAEGMSLIAVNFTDVEQTVPFVFTRTGDYIEQLHRLDNFAAEEGQERWLAIPSNYGRIWRND